MFDSNVIYGPAAGPGGGGVESKFANCYCWISAKFDRVCVCVCVCSSSSAVRNFGLCELVLNENFGMVFGAMKTICMVCRRGFRKISVLFRAVMVSEAKCINQIGFIVVSFVRNGID